MLLYRVTDLKAEKINTSLLFEGNSKLELQRNGEKPRKSGENLKNKWADGYMRLKHHHKSYFCDFAVVLNREKFCPANIQ